MGGETKITVNYPFGNHSVLVAALASMFAEFKRWVDGSMREGDNDRKRKLLVLFQKAFEAAAHVDGSRPAQFNEDPLESLVNLSEASNIESWFVDLMRETGYRPEFDVAPLYLLTTQDERFMQKIKIWYDKSLIKQQYAN